MNNRVLLTDLARTLNVSTDTVRRDIKELDDDQKLKKVHGGAVSNSYGISSSDLLKHTYAIESKKIIADKAIQLIEDNSVILISGGTTNLEMIRHLPPDLTATFFTPSLPIAFELLSHEGIEVIFIGGRLSKESQIAVGGSALNLLSGIKADICFIGTGCLDPVNGLTDFDWEVVQMKKAMIKASKKVVSLSISEKLNTSQRYRICEIQTIDILITELEKDSPLLIPYENQHVELF